MEFSISIALRAWPRESVDQNQLPSRPAPGHCLLKYVMGMVLNQAHYKQTRQHLCVINTLNDTRTVVVFNHVNTGNERASDSRAVHDNIHCTMGMSKGQRFLQLLCDQHSKQECFGRIRQGLLEVAVLRV